MTQWDNSTTKREVDQNEEDLKNTTEEAEADIVQH